MITPPNKFGVKTGGPLLEIFIEKERERKKKKDKQKMSDKTYRIKSDSKFVEGLGFYEALRSIKTWYQAQMPDGWKVEQVLEEMGPVNVHNCVADLQRYADSIRTFLMKETVFNKQYYEKITVTSDRIEIYFVDLADVGYIRIITEAQRRFGGWRYNYRIALHREYPNQVFEIYRKRHPEHPSHNDEEERLVAYCVIKTN